MPKRSLSALSFALVLLITQPFALAEDDAHGGDNDKQTNTNVNAPGEAVKAPRTTETYSEKGATVDPVAFDIASNGDIYVAEGSRAGGSVIDNRNSGLRKSNGVINDLQKTSVEDRLEQIKMLTEGGFYPPDTFTKASDRVRLVRDTDGDGKADTSSIFADHFNDPLDGIASGVLFHEGKVYLTNIPHVWRLQDKDGDGDADKTTDGERESLSYGWGIRWAFYGHDMHGLIKGPDGRIYFSIGDRGYNVTSKEGKNFYGPDRGAVFRMWPDGSGLELYFEGLRNPQELAFDNYGNLFTGDNNSDSGDKARFIYLPEGGDSGWRQDVQSLRDRGPWNREHMWKPRDVEQFGLLQPAWIIPPLKNVGRGPSGLAHYPGTGDAFPKNGSFLMCDYPAGVRHVHIKPDGATFKVVEDSQLSVEGSTITDVAWGYDGRLYLSDWGGGWRPNPNGHLKTMVNEAAHKEQAGVIAEVKKLFAEGFEKLSDEKLIDLLGHADQRVRIHAQWEAAERPMEERLWHAMTDQKLSEFTRLHALWALGMKATSADPINEVFEIIPQAFEDSSDNVIAHAARILGEARFTTAVPRLEELLDDKSPIVQQHAAIALGKIGDAKNIGALLDLLHFNDNNDVAIRHAASYGLSLIGDAKAIAGEAKQKGPAARLGAVLALRRLDSPLLADFLEDEDKQVAAEAARAIYDKRVMEAMPALAKLAMTIPLNRMSEPVMRRVIEANVRLAEGESAMRLAQLAANTTSPEMWRLLALQELDGWAGERNREGVWGAWWPRPEQSMAYATPAMVAHLPAITTDKNGKIATLARTMTQKHIAKSGPKDLADLAMSANEPEALRLSTLGLLIDADKKLGTETARLLVNATEVSDTFRIEARKKLFNLDLPSALQSYIQALETGTLAEKQNAIARLGMHKAKGPLQEEAFINLTAALKRGDLDPALRLDVTQAIAKNDTLPTKARLAAQQYTEQNTLPGEEPFIRDTVLAGGSVERGKEIFLNQEAAQCQRCHAADGSDSVGPGLNGIAAVHDAGYLYTALVRPSAAIANGFANATVTLKDGSTLNGRIVADQSTPKELVLTNADGVITKVPRDQIKGVPVTSDQSLMPAMTDKLSPNELRDVIAYLGTLSDNPSPSYKAGGVAYAGGSSGPQVVSIAKDMRHEIWLPAILLGIFAALGALLMLTLFGGGAYQSSEH